MWLGGGWNSYKMSWLVLHARRRERMRRLAYKLVCDGLFLGVAASHNW